ncbi:hypothetical protein scyTo_0023076, partial [Scyliorhinus torazame]|nr:hypothetical protein [Scyliorhinus torazame]
RVVYLWLVCSGTGTCGWCVWVGYLWLVCLGWVPVMCVQGESNWPVTFAFLLFLLFPIGPGWSRTLQAWIIGLTELAVFVTLVYGTIHYFGLRVNWEKRMIETKTVFTFHEFTRWLKIVTPLTMWIGVLSLSWEIFTSLLSSLMVKGFIAKLWATSQWALFAVAAAAMFAVSLVPYTFIEYEASSNLRPEIRRLYDMVDRYQLVNSYGLFRRMTGVGGRPEVVVEGSYDSQRWTEIEFMYKPGNLSLAPPLVAPHQPRLDWQMWFAALGDHTHSPWFTSFIHRLLQGKKSG